MLQRIAGVINRVMRRGDFVARYGGDEFVVVLPGAGLAEAAEVARRISAAVAAEDWESLVPGTPVGVSVGFAELVRRRGAGLGGAALAQALRRGRAADAPLTRPGPVRPVAATPCGQRRVAAPSPPASRAARSASAARPAPRPGHRRAARSRLYAV